MQGDDDAILRFVISKNLHRRHLDTSQRAMIAAELANINPGVFAGNQHVPCANLHTPNLSWWTVDDAWRFIELRDRLEDDGTEGLVVDVSVLHLAASLGGDAKVTGTEAPESGILAAE